MRGIRLALLIATLTCALWAQTSWTSSQLVDFVRKSAKSATDKDLAEQIGKIVLTDRLNDDAVESCIQAGIGPRTRAALISLVDQSPDLPRQASASKPVGPPPPSEEEKARAIEKVTEYARGYLQNLPNFTCTQVTKRYAGAGSGEHLDLQDTVMENLSYSGGDETYKVVSVNNTPTSKTHWELGGTTSAGEFGTDMAVLFDPRTRTEFTWDSWTTWGGRRTHRFAYRVRQENSFWSIEFEKKQRTIAGYKGFVYVDRDLNMIMRITRESVDMPPDFPIQNVKQDTKYTFQKIGESDREFLIPATSTIMSKTGRYLVRNEIEFRLYRKFGTESIIKFEVVDETKKM